MALVAHIEEVGRREVDRADRLSAYLKVRSTARIGHMAAIKPVPKM